MNNPAVRANSIYAGYCVRASIQPFPIAIPARGTSWNVSTTSFAVCVCVGHHPLSRERARDKTGERTKGRGKRGKRGREGKGRTDIRNKLSSKALACDVSLCALLDHRRTTELQRIKEEGTQSAPCNGCHAVGLSQGQSHSSSDEVWRLPESAGTQATRML